MKQSIFQLLQNQGDLSWQQIVMQILVAAVLGFVIFISYGLSHRGTIYSKKFNVSLVLLTVLTATVMTVIGNNIALSLGMVGALSIVRFRTAIKDSRDTMYIFWALIVGICCGVSNYIVAAAGSTVAFLILIVLGAVRSDNRILLIIRGARRTEAGVEALVFQTFERKAVMRVKNTTKDTVEFIYEISDKMLQKAKKKEANLSDVFYALGDIEYVNFVMQNDEISN